MLSFSIYMDIDRFQFVYQRSIVELIVAVDICDLETSCLIFVDVPFYLM